MKKLCVLLVSVLVACWLCGCGGGSGAVAGDDQLALQQDKASATAQYLPLKLNNYWKFKDGVDTVTWKITGTEMNSGSLWYTETMTRSTGQTATAAYRHMTGGLFRRANGVQWLVLKSPVRKNAVWVATNNLGNALNFKIISVSATVTVPAGTYSNCVVVDSDITQLGIAYKARQWYAPGVGIVKSVAWANGVPVSTTLLRNSIIN